MVDGAIRYIEEFKVWVFNAAMVSSLGVGSSKSMDTRWIPSDCGKLMINVDTAINNRNGSRDLGVIIRNSLGNVVLSKTIL